MFLAPEQPRIFSPDLVSYQVTLLDSLPTFAREDAGPDILFKSLPTL
jgi:hypothetical protein